MPIKEREQEVDSCWSLLHQTFLYFCVVRSKQKKKVYLSSNSKSVFFHQLIPQLYFWWSVKQEALAVFFFFDPSISATADSFRGENSRTKQLRRKKLLYLGGGICNSLWLLITQSLMATVHSLVGLLQFQLWYPARCDQWALPPSILPYVVSTHICNRAGIEYKRNDSISLRRLGYKTHCSFHLGLSLSLITCSKTS